MTKAQDTYERVEALVAAGSSRPDAFKQLATEWGQPVNSIRGAYYIGRKQATGESGVSQPRRSRKRETTEADAIEAAVDTLMLAIVTIRREVELSAERAREATAEHESIAAMSGPRIEAIQAKIAVLSNEEVTAS